MMKFILYLPSTAFFFNTSNINQYYNQIGFILIAPIIYSDSKIKWCKQGILEILQLNDSPMSTIKFD